MSKKSEKLKVGYKIHFDRLRSIKSKADFMHTHKFKFAVENEIAAQDLWKKFEEVGDVVDSSKEGSLLWFLVQLYGLGFLFVSSDGKKELLLRKLYKKDLEKLEISSKYSQFIVDEEALEARLKSGFRNIIKDIKNNFFPQKVIDFLAEIFGVKEKIKADNLEKFEIVKKCHDELLAFALEKSALGSVELQDFFGVKIKKEEGIKTTFVIQEIAKDELKKNIEFGIDIYKAYFRYLAKASQVSGFEIQTLAGTDNNQNALSNLFGVSFAEFRVGIDNCKNLLKQGNPDYFDKNEDVLNLIAQALHKLSLKVKDAQEVDFVAGNWSEYRALFGGRLQGWLSNFENRIDLLEKTLGNDGQHFKAIELIEKNCDFKKLFSQSNILNFNKIKDLRVVLFEALKAIKGEPNNFNNQQDFGSLINEYGEYLQGFREFLMKWNNEGIPLKIDDKEIDFLAKNDEFFLNAKELCEKEKTENGLYRWSLKAVPNELERYPRFIGVAKENVSEKIKEASEDVAKIAFAGLKFVREIRAVNFDNKAKDFNEKIWLKDNSGLFFKNIEAVKKIAQKFNIYNLKQSESFKFLQHFIDLKSDDEQVKIWKNILEISNKKPLEIKKQIGGREADFSLDRVKFFLSGYERRNNKTIAINQFSFDEFLAKFENFFGLNLIKNENDLKKWLNFRDGKTSDKTSEKGEILKIYFALMLRDLPYENNKVFLPKFCDDYKIFSFTSLPSLVLDGSELKKETDILSLRRFLQSAIGAKIRNYISILSRKEFIKRNVIQITNGNQSCLKYAPVEWGDFSDLENNLKNKLDAKQYEKKISKIKNSAKKSFSENSLLVLESAGIDSSKSNKEIATEIFKIFSNQNFAAQKQLMQVLGEMPHRFEVVLMIKKEIEGLKTIENGLLIEKSSASNIYQLKQYKKPKNDYYYSFKIETSVYQKQFLERFLWQDKENILEESMAGGSIIAERKYEIDDNLSLQAKEILFYFAIPFKIENNATAELSERKLSDNFTIPNSEGKPQKQYREEKNILGIDLGEYGFGYAIFNPQLKKWKKNGFIEIELLKKLRDEVASWKDSQASGIFSRPTTYLEKLREQTAGKIRNIIHRLAIDNKAIPVYEIEVDAFETGGKRISKLYKTLKTADVFSVNSSKADEKVRKDIWGINNAMGLAVDAAQTSQTCRKCGRCATVEIVEFEGDKIIVKNGLVLDKIICSKDDGIYDKKEIRSFVKSSQRGAGEHGGQSNFICQYKNCQNSCHADIQAAQNIALKFYFKFDAEFKNEREADCGGSRVFYGINKKSKNDFSFLTTKFFLHKSKDLIL